ncbi:hypothetical protein Glove_14g52 [Diversispora epigaea]|uniref:Piwi domain-containing protein n=1 Tax=Diversispora epigaea TaxID=1348612 RepID=A0A397JX77_9GLOM|nr:hypothetical protein Glove_14g52 [Diversispora epigaea]
MIMGADISHPSVGANQPSIAAVCGSVEKTGMVYNGRYSINKEIRNETIENLEEMTTDLLRLFLERNKRKDGKGVLPQRIIFYRDGVSEGQFRSVLNREVMALKKAFEKVYSDKMPTLTFVIAQKRHHTRFVPTDPRANGDRNGNCQPGTCVDTEIVHKKEFDFYLQSHAGIQGTVRPTHYYVLYDENNFSADEFQSMTYRLCYLYARCTIATSIVPAIAYAHLLASRVRLYPVNRLDRGESNYDDDKNMSETSRYLENRSNNNFDYPQISQKLEKLMYFV